MRELKKHDNRKARFVTVITYISGDTIHYFEGEVRGEIAGAVSGDNGFGYDPLFIPEGYATTFANFSAEEKNKISHRGRAVSALVAFLKNEEKP